MFEENSKLCLKAIMDDVKNIGFSSIVINELFSIRVEIFYETNLDYHSKIQLDLFQVYRSFSNKISIKTKQIQV